MPAIKTNITYRIDAAGCRIYKVTKETITYIHIFYTEQRKHIALVQVPMHTNGRQVSDLFLSTFRATESDWLAYIAEYVQAVNCEVKQLVDL